VHQWVENFARAFVSVFVAVDAIGLLPIFIGLTEGIERPVRQKVLLQSMVTAMLVAVGFIALGRAVFSLMGISIGDFQIAGGALLFFIASKNLISETKVDREVQVMGAVPLGTPLIVSPAVLTTALMQLPMYGWEITVISVVVNIAIAGAVLLSADFFTRLLGRTGSKAVSKVMSLILAAIAVMMIRMGILEIVRGLHA